MSPLLLFFLLLSIPLSIGAVFFSRNVIDFSLKTKEPWENTRINVLNFEDRVILKYIGGNKTSGHFRISTSEFQKVIFQMKDAPVIQNEVLLKLNDNVSWNKMSVHTDDYKLKIASKLSEVEHLFKYHPYGNTSILDNTGCECIRGNCACCLNIAVPEFRHNVCVNATYNPVSIGLDLSIGVDGHYFSEEISLRNPPPICFTLPIPGAEHIAGVCVAFSDLDIDKKQKILSGCVEFEVELIHLRVLHFKIGCFKMPI